MAKKPLPPPDVPMIDAATGRVTTVWYEFFLSQSRLKLSELSDVSTTAPTNGQVMIWVTATSKFTPGAN